MNEQENQTAERLQDMDYAVTALRDLHVELAAQLAVMRTDLEAAHAIAWVCLASSPDAVAMMQRERRNFLAAMRAVGLSEVQAEGAVLRLETRLRCAEQEPRRGLPAFVHGLLFDLLTMTERACSPRRWTWRGVASLVLAMAAASVLALA